MRLLVGILILGLVSAVSAQTTVTVTATRDTSLYSENGEVSNGAGTSLFTGRTNVGGLRRALIGFDDFSAVPAGSTITGVELVLEMTRTRVGPFDVSVHKVAGSSNWGEAGSDASGQEGEGAPAQTGDATWTMRNFPNTPWATAGGDFESTSISSASVDNNGSYTFASTPAFVAAVNDWILNPTDNLGIILLTNESVTSAKRFSSHEAAANPPQLRLTIEAGGATINPSGLWFTPSAPGDGFNVVNSTSPSGDLLTFFFFGYSDNGERLWLISDSTPTPAVIGQTISVDVFDGPLGTATFATPPSGLLDWGTLDITFTSCTEGNYTLNGADGIKTADLTLLASLVGIECDDGL